MANTSQPHRPRKPVRRIKWRSIIVSVLLIGVFSFIGLSTYVAATLPAFDPEQLSGSNSTLLYDENDNIFSNLNAGENRTDVSLDQIPPVLIQAFIATEDKDFYNHHGVNFKGIARAVLRNFQSGDMTGQGASTITQQLARTAFLTSDKNWLRKIKEVFLAFRIESAYSKEDILEMYLNKIYFGAGAYGVQAASNTYFDKDVSQLTLAESSLLAGLVQSPSYFNPFVNLDKAKARQKLVLNSMVDSGFITDESATEAYDESLQLATVKDSFAQYGFYVDAVIDEASQILAGIKGYEDTDSAIYTSGLRIYTNINPSLQAYAEEYMKNAANFPANNKKGQQVQVGMAVVDNSNGDIKAIIGGREYLQQRGFNRATSAYRQPGSSIKPLTVYSPALEQGYMPFLVLNDAPVSYKTSNGTWTPKNYDNSYRGPITMRTAVELSINTVAVQTLDMIGIRYGFDMGNSMGLELVDTPGTNDLNLASLALGGLTRGVTTVQMAAAYSTLSNTGIYNKPHFINKIVDSRGVILYEFQPESKRVMSEQTSWLMNNILQSVVSNGTGTKAKVADVPTAGKTGTSEDLTDIWFCGITPSYSCAVWMGYDDQQYKMSNVYGGGAPALMFKAMLQKANQGKKAGSWPEPSDIVTVSVCSESGNLPSMFCPTDKVISEFCLKGYEPTETCTVHTSDDLYPLGTSTVKLCTDPRHGGKLYRANVPGLFESGGCPDKYVYEIIIPQGESLPLCPLSDHQVN